MDDSLDTISLHSGLSKLEVLSCYTFDSKMLMSQRFSSRLMNGSEVNMDRARAENIMPWELEIFTTYSVIYNDDKAVKELDLATFQRLVTYIRNYWDKAWKAFEASGDYSEVFMIRHTIQQFSTQGLYLQKLFRYSYFFNFQNEKLDMKKVLSNKFKLDYGEFDLSAFAIFLVFSKIEDNRNFLFEKRALLNIVFKNKALMEAVCIDQAEFVKETQKLYGDDLLKMYYGLNIQYWWPFIRGRDCIYLPCPFLIINAVTDSMLNRLTEGNEALRQLVGKEIIEQYVYDLYRQINETDWVSREIEYRGQKGNERTPDVIVAEGGYCTFYDTKEMTPSLKVRELDRDELRKDAQRYVVAISKMYHQIRNYLSGAYGLNGQYDSQHLFGVIVLLEDIAFSRSKIYEMAFEMISREYGDLGADDERYIRSHIKIISLRQLEFALLANNSFLPSLIRQAGDERLWDNLWFLNLIEDRGLLPVYEHYVTDIKKRFRSLSKVAEGQENRTYE